MALPEPLEKLVGLLGRFPGIGEKSARRMAFYLLQQPSALTSEIAEALVALRENLHPCPLCGSMTDRDPCPICTDPLRDRGTLCVVESAEDLISLEQAGVYSGLYYVLGGRVSPMDDEYIPPDVFEKLRERIRILETREVIIATNPRVEGDLTYFAVLEQIGDLSVRASRLAFGLPVGGSIGFADRVTLHAALEARREVKEQQQ